MLSNALYVILSNAKNLGTLYVILNEVKNLGILGDRLAQCQDPSSLNALRRILIPTRLEMPLWESSPDCSRTLPQDDRAWWHRMTF